MGDFSVDYAVRSLSGDLERNLRRAARELGLSSEGLSLRDVRLLRRRALLECHVAEAEQDLLFAIAEAGDDWSEVFRRGRPESLRLRRQLESFEP